MALKIMQDAVASPDDLEIQMQCADIEVVSGYLSNLLLRALLRLIQLLDGAEKKIAKDRLLELFALVDPADPRVIKARAALANALF
jgi:putative thioredoxin